MIFGEEIGPSEVVIPEQRLYSCFGCKFYDHNMVRSGQYPVYESVCKKLNSMGVELEDGELCLFKYQLDRDNKTPDCCPYLKANIRNDKIDKIL